MDLRAVDIARILQIASLTGAFLLMYSMYKWLDPSVASKDAKKLARKLLTSLGVDPNIPLSDYEIKIATQLVETDTDGADWSDLGGCETLIQELKDRIILPLKVRAEQRGVVVQSQLLAPPKGVLFHGPPGCGKTLMAKALARAANARFINLQVAHLTDKWYGETQKLAAAVFSLASKLQPTIIFIDEIDSFLRDRQSHDHEATAMMKAQFMSLWDGFASSNDVDIIVMGATNRPQDVDKAILRRMPARFQVPMPDPRSLGGLHRCIYSAIRFENAKARTAIFRVILRDEPVDASVDFERVANAAVNLSGSDMKEVCRLAVLTRVKFLDDKGIRPADSVEQRPITEADLLAAVTRYQNTALSPICNGTFLVHDDTLD